MEQTASKKPMALDSFGGRVHARWSPDEAVTPLGQLPFFIDFLKQADLFDPYVDSKIPQLAPKLNSSNLDEQVIGGYENGSPIW